MKLSNLRCAIYARYSSDNQRDASIEDQVRLCSEFIRECGGTVDERFIHLDRAVSGSSLDRKGFESLMSLVERGEVDVIVTEDVSRISRDFADAAAIFKRLQYARVPLLGVADGVDTSAPDAKLMFTMKSLFAELYLDQLRDKTLRGLVGRALAKMSTGGLPYGFCSVPVADSEGRTIGHAPKIHAEQAEVVRWIFTQYRAGWALGPIAHDLNRRGVEPPRSKSKHRLKGWVDGTVRVILHNTKYVGIWEFNKTKWEKVPGTNKRRPKKATCEGHHSDRDP